ncbi:MAG: ribosome silencing factor [Chitinophagales bacterium]|nr:ribosome silencing factor [Chitinophagales bacterium]
MKALKVKKKTPARKKKPQGLVAIILDSIRDKKGEHIISIDLRKIQDAVCDFFIVCDAPSTTQVKAIADHIMQQTASLHGEKPWHHEGLQHAEWILLDYVDTVVHIFLAPQRRFYQLDELWSDGVIEEHNE